MGNIIQGNNDISAKYVNTISPYTNQLGNPRK
jgi:hypothetical protein